MMEQVQQSVARVYPEHNAAPYFGSQGRRRLESSAQHPIDTDQVMVTVLTFSCVIARESHVPPPRLR